MRELQLLVLGFELHRLRVGRARLHRARRCDLRVCTAKHQGVGAGGRGGELASLYFCRVIAASPANRSFSAVSLFWPASAAAAGSAAAAAALAAAAARFFCSSASFRAFSLAFFCSIVCQAGGGGCQPTDSLRTQTAPPRLETGASLSRGGSLRASAARHRARSHPTGLLAAKPTQLI